MTARTLPIALAFAAALVVALAGALPAAADGGDMHFPTLVGIRAAHHPGFDRVVFDFEGGLPARTVAGWTDRITDDPSDMPVDIHGNAFVIVGMSYVRAYEEVEPYDTTYGPRSRAFGLPNVAQVVNAGDFEAVVSFGIGVMKKTRILRTMRLRDPARFVVDISTNFARDPLATFFVDRVAVDTLTPPFALPVDRDVPAANTARSALVRLFSGPTMEEKAAGLRFVASGATGFSDVRVSDTGIARVWLTGRCSRHDSPVSIADEIMPTLRGLPGVQWVKIYSPSGHTQRPWSQRDSIPDCLAVP